MPAEHERALRFESAIPAGELEQGQIVVVDGTVTAADPDPDNVDRVRLRIVRLLAGVGNEPDEDEVIVSVPRAMKIATAAPVDEADLPAQRPES